MASTNVQTYVEGPINFVITPTRFSVFKQPALGVGHPPRLAPRWCMGTAIARSLPFAL